MQTNHAENRLVIRSLSAGKAFLAALPFLLYGAASLVSKLDILRAAPARLPLWQVLFIHPYLVFNWLILVGLGAGFLAGFPRWAFPYLGWALIFAWWWSDMGFYGYRMGSEIWLPLLAVVVAALLIRRSLQPLRHMLAGLWRDWTLFSLGLYIFYVWFMVMFDENHHPYLLAFIALSTLMASAGAWLYFQQASAMRRVLALLGGLFMLVIIGVINNATWDYRAYYGLPEKSGNISLVGLIFLIILSAGLLSTGLLMVWRKHRASVHPDQSSHDKHPPLS